MSGQKDEPYSAARKLDYARSGFIPVACLVADIIRASEDVIPVSSKTDFDGEYGEPEVYTEWGLRTSETPVLHEHRWPGSHSGEPDPYRCEHYAAAPKEPTS